MSSLFGTISISLRALLAQQAALQTTSDNIANMNTEGYCRKRAVLTEDTTTLDGGNIAGNGVHVENVQSLRDRVLELRMHDETQQQGALNSYINATSQVESLFADVDNGVGAKLDQLFNTFTALSVDPSNIPRRQNVLIAAGNLTEAMRTSAQKLTGLQQTLDFGVDQGVSEVNQLTTQIASLNAEVNRLEKLGADASTFEDQRTQLIRVLSQQIGVSVVQGDDGLTLTAGNGAPLVVGSKSFTLDTVADASGHYHIYSGSADITSEITGGNIGGILRARDSGIISVLDGLNTLAAALATSLNAANRNGVDLAGTAGLDMFAAPTSANAAANFTVIMSDPSKIAASLDGTVGDNANIKEFVNLSRSTSVAGQTPIDFYTGLVSRIGNDIATARADSESTSQMLLQLSNQRGAISGVSLDEEAADLVRFQRAFQASARVVSVVDEMLQTLLSMGQR